jgi:HpcH/HpaI aldolase/citrate lyase family
MKSVAPLELLVFHRSVEEDEPCLQGGASGVVIDLEVRGKELRQRGFDTQINAHSLADLERVKSRLGCFVLCRVNAFSAQARHEYVAALGAGADEILVPMVRDREEVERIFEIVGDPSRVGLMIETEEAVRSADQLAAMAPSRLYLGLNDLHICRQSSSIFAAIADGTVEGVRRRIGAIPFGFGGLTIPGRGTPLAVELLLNEMARLRCRFTFLRRSFFRDTVERQVDLEIPRILAAVVAAFERPDATIAADHAGLRRRLHELLEVAA